MPDLNPIHYLLIGFIGLSAVLGGLYYFQGHQFELEKARHAAFVAETKEAGIVQEQKGKEQNEKHIQEKKNADAQIQAARNSLVAYADRLRQSAKNPGRRLLPPSPSGSGSSEGTCFDSAGLNAAMGEYVEALGSIRREATELVIEGAKGVSDLDGAKKWAQQQ
jgi:hypothetical protein